MEAKHDKKTTAIMNLLEMCDRMGMRDNPTVMAARAEFPLPAEEPPAKEPLKPVESTGAKAHK